MIYLALIAVIEAVVYQRRYRSATHGGPIEAAWWALCTCVLRFAAPLLGVSEFFRGGDPVLLTAVYAVPAAIATGLVRWWELKPTASLNDFISSQERADAAKFSASRIGPTNTERGA